MYDSIRLLKLEDAPALQDLCEKSTDYFLICEGAPPSEEAAYEILEELPPNKELKDKAVFGFFDEAEELLAVADMVKDYPTMNEWIIGLLLIDPAQRGKGMGKQIQGFIYNLARESGAEKLRIGVVEDNKNALGFWSSLGYEETTRVRSKIGRKESTIIIMNLPIIK